MQYVFSILERFPAQIHICFGSKTGPSDIKSLIRPFCATPAADSTQLRAGPDYEGAAVWGPENNVKSCNINYAYGIFFLNGV